jgi:hypothetical protein
MSHDAYVMASSMRAGHSVPVLDFGAKCDLNGGKP